MFDLIDNSRSLTKKEFVKLLDDLNDAYHNNDIDQSDEIIDDDIYDNLEDIFKERFGEKYTRIGAVPKHKEKVKLDYFLGSLDKMKKPKEVEDWIKKRKGPFSRQAKLDGVSCEYVNKKLDGEWIQTLRTRGNGVEGTNISHLLKYLELPTFTTHFACRAEIVMPRKVFLKKYKSKKANPRNMVSGLVNSKHFEISEIKDLHVVAYQVLGKSGITLKPSEHLQVLKNKGFKTTLSDLAEKSEMSIEKLNKHYLKWESEYDYEIDGTVIYDDIEAEWPIGKNPDHAIAFKVNTYCFVKVKHVEYRKSKHAKLIPRVWFEPVFLSGARIEKATGHHANHIIDNGIGPGAIIEVTRSGKVIPYIHRVIHSVDAQYPEGTEGEDWDWNKSCVDIICTNIDDNIEMKRLHNFFTVMDAKYMGDKTIKKLYVNGFDTFAKIFSATVEDIKTIDTFKQKASERIYNAIQKSITNVSLVDMMAASGVFGMGFGKKKLEPLIDEHPNIMDMFEKLDTDELVSKVKSVQGFADKTANQFVENLPEFYNFMVDHVEYIKFEKPEDEDEIEICFEDEENENNENKENVSGKSIVFTGHHDKELEKKIKKMKGFVKTSVSKKTDIVVTKQRFSGSSKEIDADKLNIPVYTFEEFKDKYGL